jgi:hypothetical protein
MRRMTAIALVVLSAVGCGRSSDLPDAVAAELRDRMTAIRTAAGAGNRAQAEAALAELRRRVVEFEQAGQVDDRKADEILGAAADVETQLALLPAPAPPPPAPTTVTTAAEEEREGERRGKKKDYEQDD